MPMNVALVAIGSIVSACALGCIIHHECHRRRNGLTPDGRNFSSKGKNDILKRYQAREALRAEQRMHDSWSIRNPASMRIRNPESIIHPPSVVSSSLPSHSSSIMREWMNDFGAL